MRTIEIDLDIHKLIVNEQRSFEETDNAVLRRLLKLDVPTKVAEASVVTVVAGRPWKGTNRRTKKVVVIPHGEEIFGIYNSYKISGFIDDGQIRVGSKHYADLSPAIMDNVRTKQGEVTSLNGWLHWHRKISGRLVRMTDII